MRKEGTMKNSQWRNKIIKRNPEIFKHWEHLNWKKKTLFYTLKSENYLLSLSILET